MSQHDEDRIDASGAPPSGIRRRDDGGPAFPHEVPQGMGAGGSVSRHHPGMPLRDYFAARAMQGIVADMAGAIANDDRPDRLRRALENTARLSFAMADAMLEARKR